ncbi:expressed unknown protein [Seminavis robusta]|uniref:Transmembrane protein n=1 Tax=Seminavis robusta TaxID=568900 RepID=A0A9N8H8X1_9STRA|nr:expressed unknown protein [Seminavis robusta]|eukprot:Sro255_g100310.1 n/a (499) ;mRNA; r:16974-18470
MTKARSSSQPAAGSKRSASLPKNGSRASITNAKKKPRASSVPPQKKKATVTASAAAKRKSAPPSKKTPAAVKKKPTKSTTSTAKTSTTSKANPKKSVNNKPSTATKTSTATAAKKKATSTPTKPTTGSTTAAKTASTNKKNTAPAKTKSNSTTSSATTNKKNAATTNKKQDTPKDTPEEIPLTPEEQHIQKLLGEGAYHLPGNTTWWSDWIQYFANNHPLFSACFQHPLHPISKWMRLVQIIGSIMVGLVITNIIFLLFIQNDNPQDELVSALKPKQSLDEKRQIIEDYTTVDLSPGMLLLWTAGSAIHAVWDNTVWYATSCACITADAVWVRKTKKFCNVLVVTGVIIIGAVATLSVVIRAHVEGGGELDYSQLNNGAASNITQSLVDSKSISNKENYEFLLSYLVELVSAWFFWFPVIETILFSGVLARLCCCACGRELCGGRPGELQQEEEDIEAQKEQPKNNKKNQSTSNNKKASTANNKKPLAANKKKTAKQS